MAGRDDPSTWPSPAATPLAYLGEVHWRLARWDRALALNPNSRLGARAHAWVECMWPARKGDGAVSTGSMRLSPLDPEMASTSVDWLMRT